MTDKTFTKQLTTKDNLLQLINNDASWTVGALMALYQRQTIEEQGAKGTWHQNNQGFNAVDANILSDIAQYYERRKYLTDRQVNFVRTKLRKYLHQLCNYNLKPLPIKGKKEKLNTEQNKQAEMGKDGESINITFTFSPNTIVKIKTLSGRRWNPKKKRWTCNLYAQAVEMLLKWGFSLGPILADWRKELLEKENIQVEDIPGLKDTLRPFQHKGVEFIQKRKGRALIGDEMGLGKTIQALAWLQLNKKSALPAIVVCPASLKYNWRKETKHWTDIPVYVLSGTVPDIDIIQDYQDNIFIINYDILNAWLPILKKTQPKTVIIDESHFIKNKQAQRTRAMKTLCKGVPYTIALSGTPVINRPVEIYNTVDIINPFLFPNFWRFAQTYCDAKHNRFGWDFGGASNTKELYDILTNSIMLRRLKRDVLKELPEKTRSIVPLEIDNREEYEKATNNIIAWIQANEGAEKTQKASQAEVLVRFEKLKQLCVQGKMRQAISWIRDFIDTDEKLVVFTMHKDVINILIKEFGDIAVKVDGNVSIEKRNEAVDLFQNDLACRLFIGNIKAAGAGLTLTAASNTAFLELAWTPGDMTQAEDRVHRIGQKADSINAWYLIAQNTIEEEIAEMIDHKAKVLAKVLDGEDVKEDALLTELLDKYLKGGKE